MAGLLGDIFSAGNVAKRKLTDLLGNPILSAQQMLGNLNDRARVLNEMTTAAAREGVSYGPSSQQLGGLLSEAYNPIGLTVFHGSPAKFQKFDPTKIGSGEGAQSYGYGHYVAESPEVAKDYQRRLAKEAQATDLNTKMQMVDVGGKPLTSFNVDMDASLLDAAKAGKKEFVNLAESKKARWESLSQDQSYPFQDYAKQKVGAYNSLLDAAKKSDVDYTGTGMFYEIDLPDEQIAKMLDWDKPLSQQPEILKQLTPESMGLKLREPVNSGYMAYIAPNGKPIGLQMKGTTPEKFRESWLKRLQEIGDLEGGAGRAIGYLGGTSSDLAPSVSEAMRQAGVTGIRYLDQGSRGTGQGTSNFVVFPGNEDLLRILERNNQPLSLLD